MSAEEKARGFTVTDRRSVGAAAETPEGAGGKASSAGASAEDLPPLPAVDFHTFLLSLGSSALMHLGEIESPESGQPIKNLPMAKHTIDILAMLQVKTKGNLTPPEEQLLESLLYDLRLRFVEASKG